MKKQIGRFVAQKLIHEGTFFNVYQARDHELEMDVAIRLFNVKCEFANYPPESWRYRFLLSARLSNDIDHPNIATIFEFARTEDGTPFTVSPYYPLTLADVIGTSTTDPDKIAALPQKDRPKKLPFKEAMSVIRQVSQGVNQLHLRNIVHRDIRPDNILLTFQTSGLAKLSGFEMSKHPDLQITFDGDTLGFLPYLSPEQKRDSNRVDFRTDVYSLGVLAYRLLTGEVPNGITKRPLHKVKEVNEDLENIIRGAMQKNKTKRPRNAGVLLDQLTEIGY